MTVFTCVLCHAPFAITRLHLDAGCDVGSTSLVQSPFWQVLSSLDCSVLFFFQQCKDKCIKLMYFLFVRFDISQYRFVCPYNYVKFIRLRNRASIARIKMQRTINLEGVLAKSTSIILNYDK